MKGRESQGDKEKLNLTPFANQQKQERYVYTQSNCSNHLATPRRLRQGMRFYPYCISSHPLRLGSWCAGRSDYIEQGQVTTPRRYCATLGKDKKQEARLGGTPVFVYVSINYKVLANLLNVQSLRRKGYRIEQ